MVRRTRWVLLPAAPVWRRRARVLLVGVLVLVLGATALVVVRRELSPARDSRSCSVAAQRRREASVPRRQAPLTRPAGSDTGFGQVAVGSGGYVTGLSFSADGRTRLVRTDTAGAYRWDGSRWAPIVTSASLPASDVRPALSGGVLAVAVAPSDARRAYLAFDDAIYRSEDGARTWQRSRTGVRTEANGQFRTWGSRLAVDPQNPDVVYYGTQYDGLLVSRDGARTWARVPAAQVPPGQLVRRTRKPGQKASVAEQQVSAGVSAVVVGRGAVYAASAGRGVYRSQDAGRSWSRISPPGVLTTEYLRPLGRDGLLATAYDVADPDKRAKARVWRYASGRWKDVTPPASGRRTQRGQRWHALAVDPRRPGRVAAVTKNGRLALSADGGDSWTGTDRTLVSSVRDVPWLAWGLRCGTDTMSAGEIAFDPVVRDRLWFTEGVGVWYADLGPGTPAKVTWHSQSRGIEQLVGTDVVIPPKGAAMLSAWDRPLFRSQDPRRYPTYYSPGATFGSAWSLDWSGADPRYLVASVASHQYPGDPRRSGFSTDGGVTWQRFPSVPEGSRNGFTTYGFGSMAVGKPGNVVWVPAFGRRPAYTLDGGRTWKPVTLPGVENYAVISRQPYYVRRRVLASDKADPGTFYLFVLGRGTYRSTDGGRTWEQRSGDGAQRGTDYGFNVSLKAAPRRAGELYLTPGRIAQDTTAPFLHSTDGGRTWRPVAGVRGVTAFGFGAPYAGSRADTVFIAGYVEGRYGLYRSADGARTWTFLADYPAGRTQGVGAIDGDKEVPGRFYLSIAGAGWLYGEARSAD